MQTQSTPRYGDYRFKSARKSAVESTWGLFEWMSVREPRVSANSRQLSLARKIYTRHICSVKVFHCRYRKDAETEFLILCVSAVKELQLSGGLEAPHLNLATS